MKHKRSMCTALVVCLLSVSLAGCGLFRDFDAKGYVQALLDQTFQGDVSAAVKVMEGTSRKELEKQYEEEIDIFVHDNLTSGVEMDKAMLRKYVEVTKEIFRTMKYEVKDVKKIDKKEYDVNVEIQPSDVFLAFIKAVQEHADELMEKVNNGEYQGTAEEINVQMQTDFINDSYELLKTSYKNMQYAEKETVVIKVVGNDAKEFSVDEEEIYNMIAKILRLDEIQD